MARKLLLGTRKGLLTFREHQGTWACEREDFAGVAISHAMYDPRNGTLWACLDHGHWGIKIQRSKDMGQTWEEIIAPKYPDGATRPDDGEPANASYGWIIMPGGDDQPERVYMGTEPGGLFQSDDGGDSFHLVESLWNHPTRGHWMGGGRDHAGVCSILVDPRDSDHIHIGISVGGVYESKDGGKTWEARNKGLYADYLPDPYAAYGHDPHYMLASHSNPDVLWQQNHCGVFRSANAGQTWQNISQEGGPVYFGFALAVDEADANVAWVVPAVSAEYRLPVERSLCVARTDDGGQTWQDYRVGLPQSNCYDIAFRHALDKHGDTLAFGTTSGNVYISDDRGETWRSLEQNLSLVYSVKFIETDA
ncbi:exo-alpha-sialidase [Phototrophicus methaneseepsis]|uniref:Exo-alpha-sialidase n=1 Tax=Phototrophicus methaneseepsis TaxID=2710758 RepID=A0A7S8EBV4_9CHLR|nr:sialidase family protein [Phototrophicus methaneseepsis]QPC84108.1 exo-alpha-sialidase [Phototrophicus methaneseepsis]